MALLPIDIQPGIYTETSGRTAIGRWKDGNNVRFFKGNPEKIGGWQKQIATTMIGICRSMVSWTTLSYQRLIGLGTHKKLYLSDAASFFDITPLEATGTLTGPFTTTLGSTTVLVADTGHGRNADDYVHFSGASAVGGITVDGEYTVASVPDADSYTIIHSAVATSGATGGGTVTYQYEIHPGGQNSTQGQGWGAGGWGTGTWGTARTSQYLQLARIYSLVPWGEDLIASPVDGAIYVWTATGGTSTRAAIVASAPAQNRVILLSQQLRILISLGSHDGSNADPMLIRWSDSEDYTQWTPATTNLAGDKRLDNGTEIIGGVTSRDEIVVFTDTTVYSMYQTGDDLVFGFLDKGRTVGLAGPNAAKDVNGTVYAMGRGQFYTYDGQLRVLSCDVHSRVFDNINVTQAAKVYAARNRLKSEVIWFYPSATSEENDLCVGYNYEDKNWWIGEIVKTAWLDQHPFFDEPLATGPSGSDSYLYMQETGYDADGEILPYHLVSYDAEIPAGEDTGKGEFIYKVVRIVPDFVRVVGDHTITLAGRKWPNDEEIVKDPVAFDDTVKKISAHIRARQISLKIEGDALGNDISVGGWRAECRIMGRR